MDGFTEGQGALYSSSRRRGGALDGAGGRGSARRAAWASRLLHEALHVLAAELGRVLHQLLQLRLVLLGAALAETWRTQ
eukprot:6175732-Pleurochrysis_carterae.AAC.3